MSRALPFVARQFGVAKGHIYHRRTFVASSVRAAQPVEPNGAPPQAAAATEKEAASDGEAPRDSLAAGEANRGRLARSRSSDAMPPVQLPDWFFDDAVSLYQPQQGSSADQDEGPFSDIPTRFADDAAPVKSEELETIYEYLARSFRGCLWDQRKLSGALSSIREGDLLAVERRGRAVCRGASYLVACLAYRIRDRVPRFSADDFSGTSFPFDEDFRKQIAEEVANTPTVLAEKDADDRCSYGRIRRPRTETRAYAEFRTTIRAELLLAAPPRGSKAKRPISVLLVLNSYSHSMPKRLISQVAHDLRADVVHLRASTIAELVGGYLGQTCFSAKGPISLLGYAAAEMNGRGASLLGAKDGDDGEPPSILSRMSSSSVVKIPGLAARIFGRFSQASEADENKWDDLKMTHILEEMVRARERMGHPADTPRRLIIHVHNYAELAASPDGARVLRKLRSIADRIWHKTGQPCLVVGSVPGMTASTEMREKMGEMARTHECYFVPMEMTSRSAASLREKADATSDNLGNIRAMLSAMTGRPAKIDWPPPEEEIFSDLEDYLARTVYDPSWVYRFSTQLLGYTGGADGDVYGTRALLDAFRSLDAQDGYWRDMQDTFRPYYSPLAGYIEGELETSRSPRMGPIAASRSRAAAVDYTEDERKLLPNLVSADSIKTTFDDIICPAETKDSLKALTSLSLVRPEAFLYGVLATDRIPGCLLYGPPGTGKTLLAKAVASSSGARMIEVSAASINDMWVGNSEKKVQALFSLAKKLAPLVIFIDEADALLGARETRPGRGGQRETINQFLKEWDGLNDAKAFLMVATNRPFDLDEAVLRRLPRKILLDLPLKEGRADILRILLRDEVVDPSVSLDALAAETELYSGSDLKNVCVSAAMEAVKEEIRARDAHAGPEPFAFPAKRVLRREHFDTALREISASINEDMASLRGIRKFDERYGSSRSKKRRPVVGFEVAPNDRHSGQARVRTTPGATGVGGG